MAVPSTLESWRAFVALSPTRPDAITAHQLSALSEAARAQYDELRLQWLGADFVLETPDVRNVRRLWAVLAAEARVESASLSRTLAISGAPTFGKSTMAMWIAKTYERAERRRHPTLTTADFQPAVYVVTPPATTPKMLMVAFCNTLGIPHAHRQNAQELTEQVVQVLGELRTSLVVLDEIHNVHSNRQAGAQAASTLKLFAERVDAAFLLAGIDLPRSPVFAGPVGEQLAGRAMRYDMLGYNVRSATGRQEWGALVATINDLLPLTRQSEGQLNPAAGFLFDITGGSIGRLRALVRRTAIDAILSGRERIEKSDLQRFAAATGGPPLQHTRTPPRDRCRYGVSMSDSPASTPIAPLPVRRRRLAHESMDSYIRRLAAANGTTASTVRLWLLEQGILSPGFDRQAWFAAWTSLAGRPAAHRRKRHGVPRVTERALCVRCARGEDASGQLTGLGLICLKHSAWIDPHDGSTADAAFQRVERQFRAQLAPAGLELASVEMRFAQRLVALTVTPCWIATHHSSRGTRSVPAALYAPQVGIACALFVRDGLREIACGEEKRDLVPCTEWIAAHIDRLSPIDEPWRAGALLSHAAHTCAQINAHAELSHSAVADVLERLAR